jgi:hypothetical protein
MTDQQHPTTSPLELSDEQVGEWLIDDGYPWDPSELAVITITTNRLKNVARQAYQAGADQELEACCEWLASKVMSERKYPDLRAARRPEPMSLKEQALKALDDISIASFEQDAASTIRQVLESLPD